MVGNAFAGIFIKDEKNPAYFFRMFAIVIIMTALMNF
jgi:hypothetical protein